MHATLWLLVSVGPVDDGQNRKVEPGRDDLVRLGHPGTRPDQFARQDQQLATMVAVEAIQQRIAGEVGSEFRTAARTAVGAGCTGPERDEHAIDVDEDQRPGVAGNHCDTVPLIGDALGPRIGFSGQ